MDNKKILAIDPGNELSGYVVIGAEDMRPIEIGKVTNKEIIERVQRSDFDELVIEMVASYGMPVGKAVFETCVQIGRLMQAASSVYIKTTRLYRQQVKLNICHSNRANDATITQALIDRFAPTTPNRGKGYKKEPGWFYGFKADIWQAYALAVTYLDLEKEEREF